MKLDGIAAYMYLGKSVVVGVSKYICIQEFVISSTLLYRILKIKQEMNMITF